MTWQDAVQVSDCCFAYRDRTDGGIDLRHARGIQWNCRRDGDNLQRVGRPKAGGFDDWNPVLKGIFDHIIQLPLVQTAITEDAPEALSLPLFERVDRANKRYREFRDALELVKMTEITDPALIPLLEETISQSKELILLLR